ncbi:MAG: PKD-like domain-containing protein, partial [Bacteroidales bacterium]
MNGSCELALYAGGMTGNGYRIPFATAGCAAKYRLYVHISDPAKEIIYFGFKQNGTQPLFYRVMGPDNLQVTGVAPLLTVQPAAGTNGNIATYTEAINGPQIGAVNPLGYKPLIVYPTKVGDYYLEFAQDAVGNTNNMNGTIIQFIDVSVYDLNNNVKNGRLWSNAWQFSDMSSGFSPKTNFYIYSADSIVTKLNVNNWKGGHYIFYCNEWGTVSTGNWYTDRQSLATWPGDLPEFKTFLNDPDNIVYPTGSFGSICDVRTNSKCDGSVEFQVKVNKPGKIDMSIDISPLGIDNGEDIKINADVTGSVGCTIWETINWNGKNGSGNLLNNGAVTNVKIEYLNGLTHMPIYDIEANNKGIMVDLVRPVPILDSRLKIFWDDIQVAKAPNPKSNFTGCLYTTPNGCHTWPDGDMVMFNSWWYYLSGTANVSPIISRSPEQPSQAPSGPANFCGIQTNVSYTIPAIQYANSYVWTLPDGTIRTTPSNTIVLDTLKPGTGKLSVHGANAYCDGLESPYLVITVKPMPKVLADPYTQIVCSGADANIILTSDQPNTTYTWTVWSPSSIGGLLAGAKTTTTANTRDTIIAQTLVNTSNADHPVKYTITPTVNGCTGTPIVADLTVLARMDLTVTPPSPIPTCSGSNLDIILTSSVSNVTFNWNPIFPADSITGAVNGGSTTPSDNIHIMQNLTNSGILIHEQDYEVTITRNGCISPKQGFTVTVYPLPKITNTPLKTALCSGTLFNLGLRASVSGSTFTWIRNAVIGISNPASSGNTGTINETLNNTSTSDIDVEYKLTPTGPAPLDCQGPTVSYIVTVLALPNVNAGSDLTIKNGVSTSITGDVTGRPGGFTYTWTPGAYIASDPSLDSIKTTNLYADRSYTLKAIDASGCTNSDNMTVFVVGPPLQVSPFANPAIICSGDSSTLTAFATGGSGNYTYAWTSNPVGFTSGQSVVKVSPLVDTYYTLTVNDGYNVTSTSAQVIVNPLPKQYTLSGGGEYCSGGIGMPIGLTNSQPGIMYQLQYNGTAVGMPVSGSGFPINFPNQTAAGVYSVVATSSLTGCTDDMGNSRNVIIDPLPVANAGVDFTIPHGISTTLNGSVSGGTSPFTYSWSPTGSIAAGSTTLAPNTTNIYSTTTFTLVVTDTKGCTRNDQVTVNLSGSALSVAVSASTLQICNDGSLLQLFSNASGGSGIYNYSWTKFPAGNPVWSSTQQNPWVSPNITTLYTVVVNDGYNTATAVVQIVVNPLPLKYNMMGGGNSCYSGSGVPVGLSGSQVNTAYKLFQDGVAVGPIVNGTGNQLYFGNYTASGAFTVVGTNLITGCI